MTLHFPQVLIPSSGYSGQKRKTPVASGTNPIQPHKPMVPGQGQGNQHDSCEDAKNTVNSTYIGFHGYSPECSGARSLTLPRVLKAISVLGKTPAICCRIQSVCCS